MGRFIEKWLQTFGLPNTLAPNHCRKRLTDSFRYFVAQKDDKNMSENSTSWVVKKC